VEELRGLGRRRPGEFLAGADAALGMLATAHEWAPDPHVTG
jgi:hypothetical protein